MSYNAVPTQVTGDFWTAANNNTYIRDNFKAVIPDIFTAAGQLPFASDVDTVSFLSTGSVYQYLTPDTDTGLLEYNYEENKGAIFIGGSAGIPSSDWAKVNWYSSTNAVYDTGGYYDSTAAGGDEIRIPADGVYQVSGYVMWTNDLYTTGYLRAQIGPGDFDIVGGPSPLFAEGGAARTTKLQYVYVNRFETGNIIYINVYNHSSGFLYATCFISVRYLGAST